jgi:uncharacterized protein
MWTHWRLVLLTLCTVAKAQEGHWEGAIEIPNGPLRIEVDLARQPKQGWIGTFGAPSQGTSGLPLAEIVVTENTIGFLIKGVPGEPRFKGTLSNESTTISGDFTQGGGSIPFKLTRSGDPKIAKPAVNPPISTELEGVWEGALEANGQTLRLRVKLANQDGGATGFLISLDQGSLELPIGKIAESASAVTFEVPAVKGIFTGGRKASSLTGDWSQSGGVALPLTLTRAAASK